MKPEEQRLVEEVNKVIVVTVDSVPGREIVEIKGLIESPFGSVPISKKEVHLKKLAHEMGANAVIGVKAGSVGIGGTVTPVYYGTAVVIK